VATLSTHVLDTGAGRPAAGVAVVLESVEGSVLVEARTDVDGRVGSIGDDLAAPPDRPVTARDGLSELALRVLDACPVRIGVPPERLAHVAGCEVLEVLRVLPQLELAGLVQWTGSGWRLTPPPKTDRKA